MTTPKIIEKYVTKVGKTPKTTATYVHKVGKTPKPAFPPSGEKNIKIYN